MINAVSGAGFPCGEIPRHRKKAKKNTPKKADHRHEWDPVIFSYINPNFKLTPGGFISGRSFYAGSRCLSCGKLTLGFPDGSCPMVYHVIKIPRPDGGEKTRHLVRAEYLHFPEVRVKDLFKLEKEENKDEYC